MKCHQFQKSMKKVQRKINKHDLQHNDIETKNLRKLRMNPRKKIDLKTNEYENE